jgi:predicted transcriptional regulator
MRRKSTELMGTIKAFVEEYYKNYRHSPSTTEIVDARTSQNLTQKELDRRSGINQADISCIENGTRNPSLKLLKILADGMGMVLKIEFVPKENI